MKDCNFETAVMPIDFGSRGPSSLLSLVTHEFQKIESEADTNGLMGV